MIYRTLLLLLNCSLKFLSLFYYPITIIVQKFVKRVDPYLNNSCVDDGKAGVDTRTIYTEKYYVNYSTQACRMSCLASEEVETCNCSEARFPINSSACFSEEQNKCINDILRKFTKTGLDCIA